jgi:hypothetical protein
METAGASIIVFVVITVIYIVLKQTIGYKYGDKGGPKRRNILLGIYVISVVMTQYMFNTQITSQICGTVQAGTAFWMTIIPNTIMFGLLITIFSFAPGWKAPFSNTIGYLFAYMGGARKIFMSMILQKEYSGSKGQKKKGQKGGGVEKHGDASHFKKPLIQEIYDNPSLMINEITPDNFDTFMSEMYDNRIIGKGASKCFGKLYKLVALKDCVSELVWYLLVGSLVITTSYNALQNISCKKSADAQLQAHAKWTAAQNVPEKKKTPRVYYTRE